MVSMVVASAFYTHLDVSDFPMPLDSLVASWPGCRAMYMWAWSEYWMLRRSNNLAMAQRTMTGLITWQAGMKQVASGFHHNHTGLQQVGGVTNTAWVPF